MRKFEGSPLVLVDDDADLKEVAGRTDIVVFRTIDRDGQLVVCMPQFAIEVPLDEDVDPDLAVQSAAERVIRELLAFYRALRELPPDYINAVEQAQLEVLEQTLLPWVFSELGRHPDYFTLPPLDGDLVSA